MAGHFVWADLFFIKVLQEIHQSVQDLKYRSKDLKKLKSAPVIQITFEIHIQHALCKALAVWERQFKVKTK